MKDFSFTDIRVRSKIHPDDLLAMRGKWPDPVRDIDLMMTGPTRVSLPDGRLLAKYLPGALLGSGLMGKTRLAILREIGRVVTDNRGLASGYERKVGVGTRTRTPPVASAIVGAFESAQPRKYCRTTAYTGQELARWEALHPLFQGISAYFAREVPDRYDVQQSFADRTDPAWMIPGTVFSTVTVNRSYPTGVHTDAGDLEEGFSTLAVARAGDYSGGIFTFPEYRLGVDMQHGDLLLMDAHEWHGNTPMYCNVCGAGMGSPEFYPKHDDCGSERISVVSYYRTKIAECGTADEEHAKAREWAAKRLDKSLESAPIEEVMQAQAVEEMAAESAVPPA
jgi:hypothetical protein